MAAVATAVKGHVAKPDFFDGDKTKFRAWWRSIILYTGDVGNGLNTDTKKVGVAYSYIRGPNVEAWTANFFDTHFDESTELWTISWADAKVAIKARFEDANLKEQAQIKLENLRQGKRSAEDFFTEFETLMRQASYQKTDQFVIQLVRRHASKEIVDALCMSATIPTTYDQWREKIILLDNQRRQREEETRLTQRGWQPNPNARPYQPPQQQTPQKTTATPNNQTDGQRRDGTGVTFLGRGQPMDLDRSCLKCKAKKSEKGTCGSPWHTPNRKGIAAQIRKVDWSTPAGRTDLATAVKAWAAADPEGFKNAGFGFGTD